MREIIFKLLDKYKKDMIETTWLLTWLNINVVILNVTLQLLVLYIDIDLDVDLIVIQDFCYDSHFRLA